MGCEDPETRSRVVNSNEKPKLNEPSKVRLFNTLKEVAVALHLSGKYTNVLVVRYCLVKYHCLIMPSLFSTWVHKHYVEHMLKLQLFRNKRIRYYESRETGTDVRRMYYVNNVEGYFQEVFLEQAIGYADFPDNFHVMIHQMTTLYLRKHSVNYKFIIITTTENAITKTSVFIDHIFFLCI